MDTTILTRTLHQRRVDDLMRKAGQDLPDRPTVPDERTRLLRVKLILEEALETVRELGFDLVVGAGGADSACLTEKDVFRAVAQFRPNGLENLEGIADGCADVIVVTTGTLSACGISDDAVQREVDYNNLTKFEHRCPKCGRTDQITHNLDKGNGWVFCTACNTDWQSGHRNEAGKWVKPSNHKPPRIAEVLADQTKIVEACVAKTAEMKTFDDLSNDLQCFGNDYLPSSNACQGCPKQLKERCIAKFLGQ